MTRPLRVLHLSGTTTDGFNADLSHLYARDCARACADPARWEFVYADLCADGSWRFPDGLDDAALAAAPRVGVGEAVGRLVDLAPDVVVPQLFDHAGMTDVRALLDLLGLPYVGNPPTVMAVAARKDQARAIVAAAGVAVPAGEVVARGAVGGEPSSIPLPVVVKPVDGDNSHGVTLVREHADLPDALEAAWAVSGAALVERFVPLGREVRCGTVERDGGVVALPLEEYAVDAEHKPVRDAADKLTRDDDGRLGLVAKDADHAWIVADDDPDVAAVQAAAVACHMALGCRQYGLFDFRIDPAGQPWFLEAGPYCSFAEQSVLVTMAGAAGIPLPRLFADTVESAIVDSSLRLSRHPVAHPDIPTRRHPEERGA